MTMSEEQNYPSLIQQGKNLAQFSWKLIKYLQENNEDEQNKTLVVSDEIYNKRLEICKSCSKFDEKQNRCIECGCYLPAKAKFILDDCPLNKWTMSENEWESAFNNILKDMNDDIN